MPQKLAMVTLVVAEYDEAIAFYTEALGFRLVENRDLGEGKRWVVVAPLGEGGAHVLLAKATNERQISRIGDQTGGRVALFLETDNLARDHAKLRQNGVRFVQEPREGPYGKVAVFVDLYGNRWDLIQPKD